jgi:hypothetical protein
MLRKVIASAKLGDTDSVSAVRNVLRAWADEGYPDEVIALAEALCDVRDLLARRESERN